MDTCRPPLSHASRRMTPVANMLVGSSVQPPWTCFLQLLWPCHKYAIGSSVQLPRTSFVQLLGSSQISHQASPLSQPLTSKPSSQPFASSTLQQFTSPSLSPSQCSSRTPPAGHTHSGPMPAPPPYAKLPRRAVEEYLNKESDQKINVNATEEKSKEFNVAKCLFGYKVREGLIRKFVWEWLRNDASETEILHSNQHEKARHHMILYQMEIYCRKKHWRHDNRIFLCNYRRRCDTLDKSTETHCGRSFPNGS